MLLCYFGLRGDMMKNSRINNWMLNHWPENKVLDEAFHVVWAKKNNSTIPVGVLSDGLRQFLNRKHYWRGGKR